jgi:hypothetical protein
LIGICVQPPELNVEIIVDEQKRADNILQLVAIEAKKKAKVEEKKKQAIKRRLANEQWRINILNPIWSTSFSLVSLQRHLPLET